MDKPLTRGEAIFGFIILFPFYELLRTLGRLLWLVVSS